MKRTFVVLLTAAVMSCGDHVALPAVEARSAHFRYFATSADRIPSGVLDRLERHRADVLGYLGMSSERVIRYYRFDTAQDFNRLDRCKEALGCTQGDELFTTLAFDQHELVHAYLSEFQPGYLVSEGTAEAFHCGENLRDWVFAKPAELDWRKTVGQSPSHTDVYRWGVRLTLHLLRTHGPQRFLAYYRSAHQTDDPALFALEFERFWGTPLDLVWQTLSAQLGAPALPICPCGAASLALDGARMFLSEFDDYRTLPAIGEQTLAISTDGIPLRLARCDAVAPESLASGSVAGPVSGSSTSLLRLPVGRYFLASDNAGFLSATATDLINAHCSSAGVFTVPTDTVRFSLAVPSLPTSAGWFVGLGENFWMHRTDGGSSDAILIGDCSGSSYRETFSPDTWLGVTNAIVNLTPIAMPDPGHMRVFLFEVRR